jgi:hypothetical protein
MTDKKDTTSIWDELRKPFPPEAIGEMSRGGAKLKYVGHAAVTDRLNTVAGPENWDWEPLSVDENSLPRLDSKGNLWIKLTIHGVTRLGYGDGSSSIKELIGDALRNAAMRFGVALDLWTKEELESGIGTGTRLNRPSVGSAPAPATKLQIRTIVDEMRKQDILDEDMADIMRDSFDVVDPHKMTESEANRVLEGLKVKA